MVRRVVPGSGEQGARAFASNIEVETLELDAFPDWMFDDLRGQVHVSSMQRRGTEPSPPPRVLTRGGHGFSFSAVPPEGMAALDSLDEERAQAEVDAALPALVARLGLDGRLARNTITLEAVFRGEAHLQLDDGVERPLRPGDTIAQDEAWQVWCSSGPESV